MPHAKLPGAVQPGLSDLTQRRLTTHDGGDEWGDGGIADQEFAHVDEKDAEFLDIDDINLTRGLDSHVVQGSNRSFLSGQEETTGSAQLANGRWACSHRCKDKTKCKHLCCREGLEKRPKAKTCKPKITCPEPEKANLGASSKVQSKLDVVPRKKKRAFGKQQPEHVDLSLEQQPVFDTMFDTNLPKSDRLTYSHKDVEKPHRIFGDRVQAPLYSYSSLQEPHLEFLDAQTDGNTTVSPTDEFDGFDESLMDDLLDAGVLFDNTQRNDSSFAADVVCSNEDDEAAYMDDDQEMLNAALVGAEDSHLLKQLRDDLDLMVPTDANDWPHTVTDPLQHDAVVENSDDSNLFVAHKLDPAKDSVVYGFNQDTLKLGKRKARDVVYNRVRTDISPCKKRCKNGGGDLLDSEMLSQEADVEVKSEIAVPTDMLTLVVYGEEVLDVRTEREDSPPRPGTPELRAWLAAELGDCVELVDIME